ncbi:MAG TPA: hypothetical protein VFI29_17065 [Hanamia sp.]|nr:hypothetical protein [Hanamia sp.]
MIEREYIKIKKPVPLPDYTFLLRDLSDEFWQGWVFYYLLMFYKNYDTSELRNRIQKEQHKKFPRVEREIAKYLRVYLNNNREFNLNFNAFGENTNDEEKEGNYDITIHNTYWSSDFHFECKNLTPKANLINEYVYVSSKKDGGIYRYFNGKYAQSQNFGGMLGFVLEGDIHVIKDKIIEKMKVPFDISSEGDLLETELNSIENNDFTFNSIHNRLGQNFKLHHLLFKLL